MPINNDKKPKKFPMEIKMGKEPTTKFVNNLNSIDVSLVMAPEYEDIREGCIAFANATWADEPWSKEDIRNNMSEATMDKFMYHIFTKKILPTTMENISLTFLIDGISLVEVTHILRYRGATFSAECTGDKFLHDKEFLVPQSITAVEEFNEEYERICLDAKNLYCAMVNSGGVNIHDARFILPRSLETYYYMRMNLKDAMLFIYDRIDKQIQPQADNVIAYGMIKCLVEKYPILARIFTPAYLHRQADFFVKTAGQYRSTNWYMPDKDSDTFEYNQLDFVYGKERDEFGIVEGGINVFRSIFEDTEQCLKLKYDESFSKWEADSLESDITEEEIGWMK